MLKVARHTCVGREIPCHGALSKYHLRLHKRAASCVSPVSAPPPSRISTHHALPLSSTVPSFVLEACDCELDSSSFGPELPAGTALSVNAGPPPPPPPSEVASPPARASSHRETCHSCKQAYNRIVVSQTGDGILTTQDAQGIRHVAFQNQELPGCVPASPRQSSLGPT